MLTMEKPLSNVQQELLKIYSSDIKEEELSDLKQVLAIFLPIDLQRMLIISGKNRS